MSLQHQAKFDALIVAKGGATFDTAENPKHFPPRLELEPTHLAFDLFFDLENKCVSGTQTTTVKANRNGVGENRRPEHQQRQHQASITTDPAGPGTGLACCRAALDRPRTALATLGFYRINPAGYLNHLTD